MPSCQRKQRYHATQSHRAVYREEDCSRVQVERVVLYALALTYPATPQIYFAPPANSSAIVFGEADPPSKNRFCSLRLDSHHRIRLD